MPGEGRGGCRGPRGGAGGLTAPAHAATNLNSCLYSYDTSGATWPSRRRPAGVATAAPGDVVALNGVDGDRRVAGLDGRYGYNLGLLHAGDNEIPVRSGSRSRRRNTAERVQFQEVETVAETTIKVSGGEFQSATPFRYGVPPLPRRNGRRAAGRSSSAQAGVGLAPATPGRAGRPAAEAARQHLHQGGAGRGHVRPGLRHGHVPRRRGRAPGAAARAVRDRRRAGLRLHCAGAGRVGERGSRAPARPSPGGGGGRVQLRAVGPLPPAGVVPVVALQPRGCWSRATTR